VSGQPQRHGGVQGHVGQELPVFVDPEGRRARRLSAAAAVAALAGAAVLVALGLGSLGLGSLPGLPSVLGGGEEKAPPAARVPSPSPAAVARDQAPAPAPVATPSAAPLRSLPNLPAMN